MDASRRGLLVFSSMLASLLYTIDTTIANIALPHMQGGLQATQDQIAWVLTSYIVVSAVAIPLTGFLAARFGLRRVLILSVAGFTATSLLCGMAATLDQMVLYRALQGACGAALVPLAHVALINAHPPEQYGRVTALWGMGVVIGPIIGPVLGGYLTEAFSWRWVFLVNLPFGVLALAGLAASLPGGDADASRRFDKLGFVLLALALTLLQLVVERGHGEDWFQSPWILAGTALGLTILFMFVVHSATTDNPFFAPAMFRDRNFVFSAGMMFFTGIAVLAPMVLMPPFLQGLQGYPVIAAGWLLASRGMSSMLAMGVSGKLVNHVDARVLITLGLLMMGASLWAMGGFNQDTPWQSVVATSLVMGLGLPLMFMPISVVAFATLPDVLRAEASSLLTLIRSLGSAMGIAAAVAVLSHDTQANQAMLVERIGSFEHSHWERLSVAAGEASIPLAMEQVSRQASAIAYSNDFHLLATAMFLAIPLVFGLKVGRSHH